VVIAAKQRVHFGPYELDARAGELYKHGLKLKLQGHPIQILAMLLERPGELITREEIQQKLWPSESETFVDFEHGLNTAVRKLRQALGDEAETPQYIETLPRRGYRFVGEVAQEELMPPASLESTVGVSDGSHVGPTAKIAGSAAVADAGFALVGDIGSRRRRLSYRAAFVVLLIFVLACAAAVLLSLSWFGPRMLTVVNTKRLTFNQHVGVGFGGAATLEVYDSIQTDGRRIYYTVEADQPLRSVSVGGGDERVMSSTFPPVILHLSPDASTLLIKSAKDANRSTESQIWMMRVDGGSAMKLGEVKAQDAAFAPDGKTIVFAKGRDLYLTDLQGNSPVKLATVQGRAFWLRWSPDGSKLRFSIVDPKKLTYTLWELRPNGSARQLLARWQKDSQVCCGNWIANEEYFTFRKISDLDEVWVWREHGLAGSMEEPTLLSAGGMELGTPVSSPLEKKIFATGASVLPEAMIRDPQSSELSSLEVGLPVYRVNYSRNGRMLAALGLPELGGSLWRISGDGREKQQLTPAQLMIEMAEYSPDGQHIAMMARWPDQPWRIYWIAAEGGALHDVPSDVVNQGDPSWSADGQSLVFGQPPIYVAESGTERNLYLCDLRSGKTSKLPNTTGLFSPRWSPDGRYIGALTIDERAVVVIDLKTGEQRRLNHNERIDHPFWSTDSQWIYYNRFPREQMDSSGRAWQVSSRSVWRLNVRDGRLEEVRVKVDPLRCTRWTANGMRPDGALLFSCFRLYRDLYALGWK
jgi:Tol biopolymer transport system component/DNA-binding winged helix-turn-helix (wHTH) protein